MKYSATFFLAFLITTSLNAEHKLAEELGRVLHKPFSSSVTVGVKDVESSTLRITMKNDPLAKRDQNIPHFDTFPNDSSFDYFFWKTAFNGGNTSKPNLIINLKPAKQIKLEKPAEKEVTTKNLIKIIENNLTTEDIIMEMACVNGTYKVSFASNRTPSCQGLLTFTIESFAEKAPVSHMLILGDNMQNTSEFLSVLKAQLVRNIDDREINNPPEGLYN